MYKRQISHVTFPFRFWVTTCFIRSSSVAELVGNSHRCVSAGNAGRGCAWWRHHGGPRASPCPPPLWRCCGAWAAPSVGWVHSACRCTPGSESENLSLTETHSPRGHHFKTTGKHLTLFPEVLFKVALVRDNFLLKSGPVVGHLFTWTSGC